MTLSAQDTFPNYLALCVAIIKGMENADAAFRLTERLDRSSNQPHHPQKIEFTTEEIAEMKRLHDGGMIYKDIGLMFGITRSVVCEKIKKFEAEALKHT